MRAIVQTRKQLEISTAEMREARLVAVGNCLEV